MDIEWRKERAEAMKTQINAPTVSVGRMAPFVETREEREARKGRTKDRRG